MHRAFLGIGVAFVAVGLASATAASGIVWSTFVTLGVVFLALAFAFRGGSDRAGAGSTVDEDA